MALSLDVRNWFRPKPQILAARRLYAAIVAQARLPEFYAHWGVPDTPTGRFDLISLHGFLVMHRLKSEPVVRPLAQALADTVVDDLDRNLREMGTGDLSVGKKVKGLMQGYFGRLEAYETGLAGDAGTLSAALTRNLYGSAEPTAEQLDAMVQYVRCGVAVLASQSVESLGDGEMAFGPMPQICPKETS